jgi:hypothetical protein
VIQAITWLAKEGPAAIWLADSEQATVSWDTADLGPSSLVAPM